MEFGVLGQVEAWREGERLALGPIKQRSLLALLVIHANQAVSTDQIIDELWGEGQAGDRHNALWIQVSKLRSTLEPGRIPHSDGTVLTTRSPGYVLQVEPDHVDAYRFELLVEAARACAPSDPASSSLLLGEGLALWRGGAYEEFAYESFAQAEIARLDELRIEAVELRLDADLRCGRAEELVAELQSLVHQHPLREHLSAQLMLALYRSDRQADALRAYGRLRRRLAEELGLDPSAALQRLEQQIICGDPALDVLAAPPNHPARPAVRGYELREQIGVSALGLTSRAYQPAVGRELSFTRGAALRVTGPERAFPEASIDHRHAGQVAARDQRVRETRLQRKSRRRAAVLIGSSAALVAVTTVAASQVAHSRATDRLADASTQAHRLAVASTSVATRQPDLAMLLALQSLSISAHQRLPALAEAEDALHWAVQGAGLTYPTSDAPVDARSGPDGLTGVFRLSLPTLIEMAREHVTRGFTAAECHHYSLHPCPPSTTGLASPAGTGAASVPSPPPPTPASALARPLAGTTVTLLDAGWGSTSLDAELDVFEADTGINVKLVRPSNSLEPTFDRLPDGRRPDVTLVSSPDVLRTLAEARRLVDLGAYLDRDAVRSEIGDELTTQATVGSGLYWLPLSFDVKGLVWYSPRAFREAGYQVPRTMDELVALANQMAADGRTPWCLANGRGPESGWPVTDWLEALVLRVGGTELYDRWTKHDVPFDHADVRVAGALLNEVLFGPGFLHGGPSWSNQRTPDDGVPSLLGRPPACWMFEGSSSTINALAGGTARLGEDVDYFTLPPLRAGASAAAEGGGVAAAAMSDRPEVRELMRYFASATWGRLAASQSTLPFIPARTQLYVVDCVDHSASLAANGVRVRLCQDARAALRSGEWRFDASDQMPAVIGGLRADHTGGAFLQGMVDYVDHGPDSLDRVLTEIDAAWP